MIRCLFAREIVCVLLLVAGVAHAREGEVYGARSGLFAGRLTSYEVALSGARNSHALLTWKLASKGRTLSSGRQDIRFGSTGTVTAKLPLQTPPLKPGISIEAKLIIELTDDGSDQKRAAIESTITLFGPDALLSNTRFADQINMRLFDPDDTASKTLDTLGLTYRKRSKTQLVKLNEAGLIVVGAGVVLDRQHGLIDILLDRASAGERVLILEPASGALPVTNFSTGPNAQPSSLSFVDNSIIASFANGFRWETGDSEKTSRLSLHSHREAVIVRIMEPGHGRWDWLEIDYPQTGGRLIVCMLPFHGNIDQGPVPQIVFGRILAYASGVGSDPTPTTERE